MKRAQLVAKDILPYLPEVSHPSIPSGLLSRLLTERMSIDIPDDTEDHTIVEQLQCHPDRVWDRKLVSKHIGCFTILLHVVLV